MTNNAAFIKLMESYMEPKKRHEFVSHPDFTAAPSGSSGSHMQISSPQLSCHPRGEAYSAVQMIRGSTLERFTRLYKS